MPTTTAITTVRQIKFKLNRLVNIKNPFFILGQLNVEGLLYKGLIPSCATILDGSILVQGCPQRATIYTLAESFSIADCN
jgi:hypothetical protein